MTRHIYIAGPMRGHDGFNFPAFFAAEEKLRALYPDADICNPARMDCENFGLSSYLDLDPTGLDAGRTLELTPDLFTAESLREALGNDLAYIASTADLLILLPGWRQSKGARAEVATALALGISVLELNSYGMFQEMPEPAPEPGPVDVLSVGPGPEHEPSEVLWQQAFNRSQYPAPDGWTGTVYFDGVGVKAETTTGEWTDLEPEQRKIQFGHHHVQDPVVKEALNKIAEEPEPTIGEAVAKLLRPSEPDENGTVVYTEKGETRVVADSGGEKGAKLAAFDQVSAEIEVLVAEHFGKGAQKYDAHNFRRGYPWSLSYSALRRHLAAFWDPTANPYDVCGPDCDRPEPRGESEHGGTCYNHTGSLHIVAVIWHAMTLTEFFLHRKEFDDRYVYDQS